MAPKQAAEATQKSMAAMLPGQCFSVDSDFSTTTGRVCYRMLHLGRLRLLRELHDRGTIAAVADALQFTPSAVSQQLAMLEREAGVPLLERAGRGVRLTDAALVLVEHAQALLDRAALAEADLAAAAGSVAGRGRI